MSQKEAPPLEIWSEKDINTLELELDNGIDSLFVPANRKTDGNPSAGASSGQDTHPRKSERSDSPEQPLNIDAFDMGIDSEMDKLFAPAKRPETSPAPSASAGGVAAAPASGDSQPQKTAPAEAPEQTLDIDA
ncbi:MAG: hypothetical protein P4L55_16510, partial [Syntrophobacteraceae bacterium]|nr:hypothetical protein [Syntrophobacteraceae bacterium]